MKRTDAKQPAFTKHVPTIMIGKAQATEGKPSFANRVPPIALAVAQVSADKVKKCINLDYLNKLTKKNPETTAEMIEVYLEETPALIKAMKQAIDNQNWESLRIAAHSIMPSFSIMGMNKEFGNSSHKIQEYATSLRDEHSGEQAKKANIAKLNVLFLKIETVCAQAYEELQKELISLRKTKRLR